MHHAAEAGDVDDDPASSARGRRARRRARARTARRSRTSRRCCRTRTGSSRASAPRCSTATRWELYNAHRFARRGARGPRRGRGLRRAGRRRRRRPLPRAPVAPPVPARRDGRGRALRPPRGRSCSSADADPIARTRSCTRGAILAMTGEAAAASDALEAGAPARRRARRRDRAVPELPGDRAPATRGRCARASRRARGPPRRVRAAAATRTWPRCSSLDRRARRARRVRARGPRVHARARVLVARLHPRGAPLRRAAAPRALGRGARRSCARWSRASRTPGSPLLYSVPWYARLLARRGDPAAEPMLAAAWERARAQGLLIGLSYAGVAYAEWAWLRGPRRRRARRSATSCCRALPGASRGRARPLPGARRRRRAGAGASRARRRSLRARARARRAAASASRCSTRCTTLEGLRAEPAAELGPRAPARVRRALPAAAAAGDPRQPRGAHRSASSTCSRSSPTA